MEPRNIYNIADQQICKRGEIIFKEGSVGNWIYVVLSGSVEISKTLRGRKYVIDLLRPGEIFGELGIVGRTKRTATARALEDGILGIIDRELLEKEFNQLSVQFRSILETITRRFEKTLQKTGDLLNGSGTEPRRVLSLIVKDRKSLLQAYNSSKVSGGGLFLKTQRPFASGELFLLKLQLPIIPEPLKIRCEVVWNRKVGESLSGRPAGMGVKFSRITRRDFRILRGFLAAPRSA